MTELSAGSSERTGHVSGTEAQPPLSVFGRDPVSLLEDIEGPLRQAHVPPLPRNMLFDNALWRHDRGKLARARGVPKGMADLVKGHEAKRGG